MQDQTPENDTPSPAPGFGELGLDPRLVEAVEALGYEAPTPIQAQAIPPLLAGRDIIGRARTGSGKTAAFGLPLLQRVADGGAMTRAVVLTPTRELALQVTGALRGYAAGLPVKALTIYGGTSYRPQLRALEAGVPVVVGTPGRMLDLMDRGALDLSCVELLVLDEADEMLRMGFLEDVERILEATPPQRQIALFSATMPGAMWRIASTHLREPLEIQVESRALSVGHIEQRYILVPQREKLDALIRVLLGEDRGTTLVFARTRADAAGVADALVRMGLAADAMHGDLAQPARERVLHRLRTGRLDVVVATDVAARGIDVDHVTHVINLELPPGPEPYVHRIGRTGRAGRSGVAISLVSPGARRRLRYLERDLGVTIQEMAPPSDAAIARRRRAQLAAELRGALSEGPLEQERALADAVLGELLEETGTADAAALAAAAIRLLTLDRGGPLRPIPEDVPPPWARQPRQRRQDRPAPRRGARGDAPSNNDAELFLPIGRFHGVRPKDIVGAIANDTGVPGREIGRITISDRKSFVGLTATAADHVLHHHPRLVIRGVEVPVRRARGRR